MNKIFGLFLLALAFMAAARVEAGCIIGGGMLCTTVTAAYSGPGDVVSSAKMWWGLRAYSLATAGTRAANICNAADANCADVNTLANGDFDVATATGAPLNCGGAGGTCTIKTLYDQTAGNNCTAATCDVTNAALGNRPTLVFNCIGTKPCLSFASASSQKFNNINSATSVSQPVTISTVANSTNTGVQQAILTYAGGGSAQLGFRNSANNQVFGFGGTVRSATATDGSFHGLQAVINGASSDMNVDGTANTGAGGANPMVGNFNIGASAAAQFMNGQITEVGSWPSAFSSGQSSSMCHNQYVYYGSVFPTSC